MSRRTSPGRAACARALALAVAAALPAAGAQPPRSTTPAGPAASADAGAITGQVLASANRTALEGAQIAVTGTPLRALAGADGRFTIRNVPAGTHTLHVQLIGYAPNDQQITVAAGRTLTLTVEMKDVPYAMAPTVVTALGIARSEKSLGYAVQSISTKDVEKIPETTMMQALAGQSAGVQVTSSSGRPGAPARIVFRGETSFSGTNQPLFVIDGVPVSTRSDSPSNALGTGSSGSRQMDFDMENVEEISLLRGAAATALYGSRASSGAVIIKTKHGKAGQPLRFNFNSELRYDRPIIQGYLTNWAAGSDGYFCNGHILTQGGWCEPGFSGSDPSTIQSWGPNIDSLPKVVLDSLGVVRFRDARADYYQTAPTSNNSLRGTGSMGDLGAYTFGATYLNQKGINPVSKLARLNLSLNVDLKLSKRLSSNTSIQRIRSNNPYADDSFSGTDKALIDMPASTDVRVGYRPDGSAILYNGTVPSFQWLAANEYNSEVTNRWIASQQFQYTVVPGVRLANNWGLDTYVSEYARFQNERPWRTAQSLTSGGTQQRKSTNTAINDDVQLIFDNRPLMKTGINLSGLLGGNLQMQDASFVQGTGSTIVIPGYYNLSNFATQTLSANLPTRKRLLGALAQLTADYHDWAFLNLTGRNDWSSTLPTNANSYFYPSASLGVVFTEALGWHPKALSYGKVRLSRAKVGNDAPAYQLSTRYVTGSIAKGANNDQQQNGGPAVSFPFRGITAYTQSASLGNPELRPESTVEDEVGLELRFFESRARADISLYRRSSYDQIFPVPSSSATGFTSISRNAGDLRNKGAEVSLRGRPLEIGKFSWDVGVNWAKNQSRVLRLAPGVTSLSLAGYSWPQIRIMENEPYGVIWGYGWKRNCVLSDPCFQGAPAGTLLIDNNGYPIKSDELRNLGAVPPKWTGNATSEVHYKNFGLSGLLDVRRGGRLLNFETQYEVNNGRSVITADRYTYAVLDGINVNTGQANTQRVFKDRNFYIQNYGQDRHENQIESAGYVKLRELSLSYVVPSSLAHRVSLQGASLYVTARNLGVWSNFSLGDPEGDVYGGQNAGGIYFRQFPEPQTRSLVMGVRSSF